jgi:hypothetical protein
MRKKFCCYVFIALVLLLVQSSCASSSEPASPSPTYTSTSIQSPTPNPTSTATSTPIPISTATQTPTFAPTATLSFDIPSPASGTGAIVGLVRWNNEPVAKAAVKLCEDFDELACSGNQHSTNSNAEGYYIFQDVKPGSYVVLVNAFYSSWWVYHIASDSLEPQKENLKPNQTVFVKPIDIYKVDLKVSQPAHGAKISGDQPLTIKWNEYPDTVYYTLFFQDYEGRLITKTVEKNEYTFEEPLMECRYNVTVAAFNEDDIEIAENAGGLNFVVDYEPEVSCMMSVLWPPAGNNASTFLGPEMEMAWDKHPLAAYYYISLVSSGGEVLLDQEKLDKDQNRYAISLAPGYYTWEVISFDESGEELTRVGNLFGIR